MSAADTMLLEIAQTGRADLRVKIANGAIAVAASNGERGKPAELSPAAAVMLADQLYDAAELLTADSATDGGSI